MRLCDYYNPDQERSVARKKYSSIHRQSVSISADLRRRMDQVKELVNWSDVAAKAFEAKLAEITARKENKVMTDVIERLRVSLRKEQGMSFNDGFEAGRKWAENDATAPELKRLESFENITKAKSPSEWQNWFLLCGTHKPWLLLVSVIQDDKNAHPLTAQAFWKGLLGEASQEVNNGDFLRGFVEGAVDLWAKVQEQL